MNELSVTVVIIGRNEGERLLRCLQSVCEEEAAVIYVDSGSTDGSREVARAAGAQVISMDATQKFTAARARNLGLQAALSHPDPSRLIQFIDGDCELQSNWLKIAAGFLGSHPEVAVVCGRRRERFPEASVYNGLIDQEWDTAIGLSKACGGDALMRVPALDQVGGFNPNLIAGEEPELCVRLRAAQWQIWRLDVEMTLHDADITRFSQWWKRNKRAGHAFAEGKAMHGKAPEYYGVRQTRSALVWGSTIPILTLLAGMVNPWGFLLLLVWPLQVFRMKLRGFSWTSGFFLTLGKLPEAHGVLSFLWARLRGAPSILIEYK